MKKEPDILLPLGSFVYVYEKARERGKRRRINEEMKN